MTIEHEKTEIVKPPMEFSNLEYNIIYLLGEDYRANEAPRPRVTDWIYETFSDIPAENINAAIDSLIAIGILETSGDRQRITLSRKGLEKVASMGHYLDWLEN